MIGTAILFQDADSGPAMQEFPPDKITDSFAVSFVTHAQGDGTEQQQADAKAKISKIAKLKVNRLEFEEQSRALKSSSEVYKTQSTVKTWFRVGCQIRRHRLFQA